MNYIDLVNGKRPRTVEAQAEIAATGGNTSHHIPRGLSAERTDGPPMAIIAAMGEDQCPACGGTHRRRSCAICGGTRVVARRA